MKTVELIGQVDEQHQLRVTLPQDVKPGTVKVILKMPIEEDDTEPEEGFWEKAILADWAKDWNDPAEDIYTLEDGKPATGLNLN
jgi:hypothetical protein